MAEETKEISTEDLSEILKARREKLAQLVEAGKDPFVITKFDVTHHSAEIKENFEALEGKTVTIAGRDGKSLFLQCAGSSGQYSVLCGT